MQQLLIRELLFEYSLTELYEKRDQIEALMNTSDNSFKQFVIIAGFSYDLYETLSKSDYISFMKKFDKISDMFLLAYKEYGNKSIKEILDKNSPENFQQCLDSFSKYIENNHIIFWTKNECVVNKDMQLILPKNLKDQLSNIIVSIFYKLVDVSIADLMIKEKFKDTGLTAMKIIRDEMNIEQTKYLYHILAMDKPLKNYFNWKINAEYLANIGFVVIPEDLGMSYTLYSLNNNKEISCLLSRNEFDDLYTSNLLELLEVRDNSIYLKDRPLYEVLKSL